VKFGAIDDLPASAQSPVQSRERKRAVSRDDHNIMRSRISMGSVAGNGRMAEPLTGKR